MAAVLRGLIVATGQSLGATVAARSAHPASRLDRHVMVLLVSLLFLVVFTGIAAVAAEAVP